jgi:hypothetical protein
VCQHVMTASRFHKSTTRGNCDIRKHSERYLFAKVIVNEKNWIKLHIRVHIAKTTSTIGTNNRFVPTN